MPVDSLHPEYRRNLRKWRRCRAVCDGEDAVKDLGQVPGLVNAFAGAGLGGIGLGAGAFSSTTFGVSPTSPTGISPNGLLASSNMPLMGMSWDLLPPLSGHENNILAYWRYVQHAHFFPGAGRAREGFIGLLTKDGSNVTIPDSMKAFAADVTGTNVPVTIEEFTDRVIMEVITVGRCGILTEYPYRAPGGKRPNKRDAERLAIRPRWRLYHAEHITNWRVDRIGEREVLGLIVLHEFKEEPPMDGSEDEFVWVPVEQWRVMDRAAPPPQQAAMLPPEALPPFSDGKVVRVRIFRHSQSAGDPFQVVQMSFPRINGKLLPEIPFDFVGSRNSTAEVDKPPLIDAVTVNVAHYRNAAALEHGLLFTANPMPYVFGYDPDTEIGAEEAEGKVVTQATPLKWKFGSAEILVLKEEKAKAGILSATATDLSALLAAIQSKRDEMVTIVGRILAQDKIAAEAARTEKLRRQGEHGVLAAIARTASSSLTRALMRARDWSGETGDVEVEVPTDFFETGVSAQEATALADLWMKYGIIAKSDVRQQLRESGFVSRSDEEIDAELAQDPVPSIPPVPGDGGPVPAPEPAPAPPAPPAPAPKKKSKPPVPAAGSGA